VAQLGGHGGIRNPVFQHMDDTLHPMRRGH
jgi:hypothetical protein